MEPVSLGALRQYQQAKQALSPGDIASKAPALTPATDAAKNPLVQSAEAFAQVFENVEATTQAMATGQADPHSVVEALATAEVALETAVTIRNRVVEAYQELLRMPM